IGAALGQSFARQMVDEHEQALSSMLLVQWRIAEAWEAERARLDNGLGRICGADPNKRPD
ncbi:MAG: hypothetical protein VW714_07260, partial [Rhodospirillales bacterium]